MRRQIGGAAAQIPPTALVNHHGTELGPGADHVEKDGDDGLDLARGDPVVNGRIAGVDAGEEVFSFIARAELITDVGDEAAPRIKSDVQGRPMTAQDQGDEITVFTMLGEQRLQRQVGEDVTIIDEEGFVAEQVAHIGNATGGFEPHRAFVAELDRRALVTLLWKGLGIGLWDVVRVHHESRDTRRNQVIKGISDQRPVKHRHQRFRKLLRQRFQPLANACAQYKCLFHARDLRGHDEGANGSCYDGSSRPPLPQPGDEPHNARHGSHRRQCVALL